MNYTHILFDLDGTLVDSLPGIAYSVDYAFNATGYARAALDLKALLGPPIRSILKQLAVGAGESDLDALVRAFRASYDSEGWQRTAHFEGALEALEAFRGAGKQMFIVTNKPLDATTRILRRLGTHAFFREVATPDSRSPAYVSKSAILGDLVERYLIHASNSLLVGDTLEDVRAAAEVGMRAAIMTHGYGGPEASGWKRFDSFRDLVAVCLSEVQA